VIIRVIRVIRGSSLWICSYPCSNWRPRWSRRATDGKFSDAIFPLVRIRGSFTQRAGEHWTDPETFGM